MSAIDEDYILDRYLPHTFSGHCTCTNKPTKQLYLASLEENVREDSAVCLECGKWEGHTGGSTNIWDIAKALYETADSGDEVFRTHAYNTAGHLLWTGDRENV